MDQLVVATDGAIPGERVLIDGVLVPVVDHGELQLQRVRDHDRALGAALVRCYHDAVAPAAHMLFDPRAKQRLHLPVQTK